MNRNNQTDELLEACFEQMEYLTTLITDRLRQSDIPVEALFVEYWPIFINNQYVYKVWNGVEHLVPIDHKPAVPGLITAEEIMEVVNRRKILMRKF